jgi:hypothetical protein
LGWQRSKEPVVDLKDDVEQERGYSAEQRELGVARRTRAMAARGVERVKNARREARATSKARRRTRRARAQLRRWTRARMEARSESVLLSIAVSNDKASSRPGICFARALFLFNPDVRVRRAML